MDRSSAALVRRSSAALATLWFIAFLVLPWVDTTLHVDPAPPLDEKRAPAAFPPVALARADFPRYARGMEKWFNDHFGFRAGLLRLNAQVRTHWLRAPLLDNVVLGSEGYLYLGGLTRRHCRGLEPFSAADLERWRFGLEGWRDFCAARDAEVLLALVPDKQEIHHEQLLEREALLGDETRTDQLLRAFGTDGPIELLDLRETLREGRSAGPVFYRSDSHWNSDGAWLGYRAVMERVARWFPDVRVLERDEVTFRSNGRGAGDLAQLLALEHEWNERFGHQRPKESAVRSSPYALPARDYAKGMSVTPPFVTEQDAPDLPRAVVMRDSFTKALEELLPEGFSRAVFVNEGRASPIVPFDAELIDAERPDLVLVISTSRYLMAAPPEQVARIGGAFDDAALRARYRTSAELSELAEVKGLWTVPCAAIPAGKRVRVEVTFTSPGAGSLEVRYRPPAAAPTDRRRIERVATSKGWNRVRVYLPPTGTVGDLHVSPGARPEECALQRIVVAVEEGAQPAPRKPKKAL